MKKKVVAVVGANGKMGSLVVKKLQKTYKIIKIERENSLSEAKCANLIIDFASGKSSAEASKFCLESKIPLIIGSTGQSESELKTIEDCAKGVPILVCRNFSIGISILKRCILEVYRQVMPQATILEKHHGEKKDVPSGTAIELKEFIQKLSNGSVQILSERGGKEIGTHRLDFYFGDELVSFSHQAFSRDAFLKGVELSAEFMLSVSSPKLYSLDDVLN